MNVPNLKQKELTWLLRDKYELGDLEIDNVLKNSVFLKSIYIEEDILRVLKGEPLAYVIGWIDFLGCKIDLSLKTLIPRPETEFWVGQVIEDIIKDARFLPLKASTELSRMSKLEVGMTRVGDPETKFWVDKEIGKLRKKEISEIRILDLCCGSGCIGIAILKNIPNSKITFVDISEKALEQTDVNLKINKIKDSRYKIIASDLFENITGQFDFIFCNPPYVSTKEKNPDLKWEPSEALFAGKDGLDFIRKVIDQAPSFLKEGGSLFLEFGKDQRRSINRLLDKSNIKKYSFNKDQYGIYRYLSVTV